MKIPFPLGLARLLPALPFCRARQAVSVTAATITTPKPLMLVAAARGMATPHAQAAWF